MTRAEISGGQAAPVFLEEQLNDSLRNHFVENHPINIKYLARIVGVMMLAEYMGVVFHQPHDARPKHAVVAAGCLAACMRDESEPITTPEAVLSTTTTTILSRSVTSAPRAVVAPTPKQQAKPVSSTTTTTSTTMPAGSERSHQVNNVNFDPTTGIDWAWPDANCAVQLAPIYYNPNYNPKPGYNIINLNHGKTFTSNNCFNSEFNQAAKLKINTFFYFNSEGYNVNDPSEQYDKPLRCDPAVNTGNDELTNYLDCRAYNFGFNAGVDDVLVVNHRNLSAPSVLAIDVEKSRDGNYWPTDTNLNVATLKGLHQAIIGGLKPVALLDYSTNYQWGEITGGWQNGFPVWYATARPDRDSALSGYCTEKSFTGGPVWIVQYQTKTSPLDQDATCPPKAP